jgi:hypothetical protein
MMVMVVVMGVTLSLCRQSDTDDDCEGDER